MSSSTAKTPLLETVETGETVETSAPSKRPLKSDSKTWDSYEDDAQLFGKYKVTLTFFLATIDPKSGNFELDVQFKWWVRMPNDRSGSMKTGRPQMRVPSCKIEVHEQRKWIDWNNSRKDGSHLWMGTTFMTLRGFELFEVHDFPLDRQLINLKVLDFRWDPKDEDVDPGKLDVVALEVITTSTEPMWQPYTAWLVPKWRRQRLVDGVPVANRFDTQLRFERNPGYYLKTVFWVSYLILAGSLLPLGMDATEIGDRLSVFSAGMLTLVLFKYGLSEQLPSVSYGTFADTWLTLQIVFVFLAMLDALIGYWVVDAEEDKDRQSEIIAYWKSWDSFCLYVSLFGWVLIFLVHYALWRFFDGVIWKDTQAWKLFGRRPWKEVKATQEQEHTEKDGD